MTPFRVLRSVVVAVLLVVGALPLVFVATAVVGPAEPLAALALAAAVVVLAAVPTTLAYRRRGGSAWHLAQFAVGVQVLLTVLSVPARVALATPDLLAPPAPLLLAVCAVVGAYVLSYLLVLRGGAGRLRRRLAAGE
jgi:hypothetical protein